MFAFSGALIASACWDAPESFEIFSEDKGRVFVFIPDKYGMYNNTYAAVYEIIEGRRYVIYNVEDLSSFAYKSNFHFSADMMHFARTFPPMDAFEVFSNGVRTRVVTRGDFIEDFASTVGFTSIGPSYTIRWRIEEHSPYADTIAISTDEGNTFVFDIVAARFCFEHRRITSHEISEQRDLTEVSPVPSPQRERQSDDAAVLQPQFAPIGIIISSGAAIVGVGAFFVIKWKRV